MAARCLVTGASGFIGAHVVRALRARGHHVTALLRPGADPRALAGCSARSIEADYLNDRAALNAALEGADWCFHLAASYHLWLPDYGPMFAANVEGTRHVLAAAAKAGCSRIVHTSTAGCVGLPKPAPRLDEVVPSDETRIASESEMTNPYKLSKWRGEQVAASLAAEGMPVIIVNPTAPVGAWDLKPTPTGLILRDFLRRRLPAYVDTGLNWVSVRDVAEGHVLAAERGRIGERYLLGHAEGNWTLRQMMGHLEELSGIPAPTIRLPLWCAYGAAFAGEALAKATGRPPRAPLAGVRMAADKMWFDPAKAIRELGLPQTPPREALREAVEWFRAQPFA
jgi:dihydroflavonol-4-reductase